MENITSLISFTQAQERYKLKQAALSYRIKALGLKTKRQGRNTFLTFQHLSLLDDLDKFLKENPNRTINQFLSSLESEQFQQGESISEALSTTSDSSLNKRCIDDKPVISRDIGQIKTQINHILQVISHLEGTDYYTNQSLINSNFEGNEDKERELKRLRKENNQLNNRVSELNETSRMLTESNTQLINLYHQLRQVSPQKPQEYIELKNFWNAFIASQHDYDILCEIGGSVYLKTNYANLHSAKNSFYRGLSLMNR